VSAFKKEGMLEIKVSDTGTGLLKDYYEKMLCLLARQIHCCPEVLGSWTGLYIVKNFVDSRRKNLCEFRGRKRQYIYLTLPVD